jgi:hypothetical protein
MTRRELVDRVALAIAEYEGFSLTEAQARARQIPYPTLAQRNANPGNVRRWSDARGKPYPTHGGYVDFVAWASDRYPGASRNEISRRALEEGWRVLRVLIGQYLDGRYTGGQTPTFEQMFRVYAPNGDNNDPAAYARFVAAKLGARPDQRITDLIG